MCSNNFFLKSSVFICIWISLIDTPMEWRWRNAIPAVFMQQGIQGKPGNWKLSVELLWSQKTIVSMWVPTRAVAQHVQLGAHVVAAFSSALRVSLTFHLGLSPFKYFERSFWHRKCAQRLCRFFAVQKYKLSLKRPWSASWFCWRADCHRDKAPWHAGHNGSAGSPWTWCRLCQG